MVYKYIINAVFEDFINALKNFKTNKLRTILSLSGIAIGVIAVVIIANISTSLYGSMVKLFGTAGLDLLDVEPVWDFSNRKNSFELTEKYRQELKSHIPQIKNIFYNTSYRGVVSSKYVSGSNRRVNGIEYGYLEAKGFDLEYGDFFKLSDFASRRHIAIIGNSLAEQLFPEGNAIGKDIMLTIRYYEGGGRNSNLLFYFKICGVLKSKDSPMSGQNPSAYTIFLPRAVLTEELGFSKNADAACVQVYNEADISYAEIMITNFSNEWAKKATDAVYINSWKKQFERIDKTLTMVSLVLTAISAISLIVGGINIMNIMMVTVTERKKEIGIRKALGAPHSAIVKQFLIEAATLTLSGGVFGVAAGMVLSFIIIVKFIPANIEMVFIPSVKGSFIAFFVSVFIGIFFGLKPALKAAKLDPVIALAE